MFAESLSYLHKMPDRDFTPYEVTIEDITAMRRPLRRMGKRTDLLTG